MIAEVDLRNKIQRIFLDAMNVDVPSPDTDLFESGVLDSMSLVDLLVTLEQEFGWKARLEDIEIANLRSIETIARLVSGNVHP